MQVIYRIYRLFLVRDQVEYWYGNPNLIDVEQDMKTPRE